MVSVDLVAQANQGSPADHFEATKLESLATHSLYFMSSPLNAGGPPRPRRSMSLPVFGCGCVCSCVAWFCKTRIICCFDYDLVDAKNVSHLHKLLRPAEHQPTLWTANEITHVRNEIPLWVEPLQEVCNRYVMTDSPDMLSTGRRRIDQGCELHWLAHDSNPFIITPLGGDPHA